jgi:hypothetical protein
LAYADDIDIIGRTQTAMKEAFINLEKAEKKMHLQINQEKTKYMPVTKKACTDGPYHIEIGFYKFEIVHGFTYLKLEFNCKNVLSAEIQKRTLSANRCFRGIKSHLISRKTKMMYKILVRPVLTFASETWTLSKTDERLLSLFERRVLRCIFGAVWDAVCGGIDVTMNYMNYLMSQVLSGTLKLTDWGGLGMSCIWIITGQLRKCLILGQKEQGKLEDVNGGGKMV